jgi:hypothetical protein
VFFLIIVAYDPLDPNGNITIKWDIMSWTPDGYVVSTNSIATCFIFSKQIKILTYIVRELFGSSLKKKKPLYDKPSFKRPVTIILEFCRPCGPS